MIESQRSKVNKNSIVKP